MNRRVFLKSSFATLALPALESIAATTTSSALSASAKTAPMRMVFMGNSFGMHPESFFPNEAGGNYQMTRLLAPLENYRDRMTVFSHLDHGVKGGHFGVHSFLSGVREEDAKGMPEGKCWTRSGVRVPPIQGPREVYRKLFINEGENSREKAADHFEERRSILDSVMGEAKSLERRLGAKDKEKLDEYFSSVRDVENGLELEKLWSSVPKPKPNLAEPENRSYVEDIPVMFDLIALALQTDSTRIASYELAGAQFDTSFFGLSSGYHSLSHHGKKPEKVEGLVTIELYQMQQFARFLDKLSSMKEPNSDGSVLDHTMALFGSGMGNGNAHVNKDLPLVLAGGGFKHGEHKVYPKEDIRRVPLCNLYLSMLQRFGVATDSFGKSTGTLTGLDFA